MGDDSDRGGKMRPENWPLCEGQGGPSLRWTALLGKTWVERALGRTGQECFETKMKAWMTLTKCFAVAKGKRINEQ